MTQPTFDLDLLLKAALAEDLGPGDITTEALIDKNLVSRALVIAGEPLVLSGSDVFERVFRILDPDTKILKHFRDGTLIESGAIFLEVEGNLHSILSSERVALNLLQRLCGIATYTRKFIEAIKDLPVQIVDTRKTTPLWRSLEKKAVRDGGGKNHRFGLFDGILIKDNHIAACGGIRAAILKARKASHHLVKIEVEVEDLDQFQEAMAAGADVIMLDNMPPDEVRKAVALSEGKVILEASGGINLDNIRKYAAAGVNLISLGTITHSALSVDISLEISKAATPQPN